MIRKTISVIIIVAVCLAIYRLAGGDLSVALQKAIDIFSIIVNKLANVFVYLIGKVEKLT